MFYRACFSGGVSPIKFLLNVHMAKILAAYLSHGSGVMSTTS